MRSFIAVDIKNEKVEAAVEELKKIKADVKTVEPQNLHLTLKFLGEIPEDAVEKIYAAMQLSLKSFQPFDVSLRSIGVFPSLKYMRVVWVGFKEGREKLIEMQRSLESNLRELNFKPENRFDPHLTIGRVKSQRGKEELKNFVLSHADTDFGSVAVDKVELKKSVLTPKGSIYSTVREVRL